MNERYQLAGRLQKNYAASLRNSPQQSQEYEQVKIWWTIGLKAIDGLRYRQLGGRIPLWSSLFRRTASTAAVPAIAGLIRNGPECQLTSPAR
jgi:hypothetical protein